MINGHEVLVLGLLKLGCIFFVFVVDYEYLPASVFFNELLHRHLNKHVVVDFVRPSAF